MSNKPFLVCDTEGDHIFVFQYISVRMYAFALDNLWFIEILRLAVFFLTLSTV